MPIELSGHERGVEYLGSCCAVRGEFEEDGIFTASGQIDETGESQPLPSTWDSHRVLYEEEKTRREIQQISALKRL